jgi:hypothetical protein
VRLQRAAAREDFGAGLDRDVHLGLDYGTAGSNFVRLDWSTLELEVWPSPAWCLDADGQSNVSP